MRKGFCSSALLASFTAIFCLFVAPHADAGNALPTGPQMHGTPRPALPQLARSAASDQPARINPFFIENRGQVDSSIRYYFAGDGAVYFTDGGVIFSKHDTGGTRFTPGKAAIVGYGTQSQRRLGTDTASTMAATPPLFFPGLVTSGKTPASARVLSRRHSPKRGRQYHLGSGIGLATANRRAAFRLEFTGANRSVPLARRRLEGTVNYLIGNDRSRWHKRIPTYREIAYQGLFGNRPSDPAACSRGEHGNHGTVDLVYKAVPSAIKYELVVHPGASPDDIKFTYSGVHGLSTDDSGNMIIHTPLGRVVDQRPVAYQEIEGKRVEIPAGFTLLSTRESKASTLIAGKQAVYSYGFAVGPYDRDQALIIDPGFQYSTYFGGGDEELAWIMTTDSAGNAYITGETYSFDLPGTAGALDSSFSGGSDIFVAKLDPSGSSLVYSTFLGGANDTGNGVEGGDAIAVDAAGNVYLSGWTSADDFPTTPGAFDRTFAGGFSEFGIDGFVAKLDPTGSTLLYSTFLGGTDDDWGNSLTIDAAGNAFIAGVTYSPDFPVTAGAYATTHRGGLGDAFLTKLDATGSSLVYSTFFGGTGFEEGGSVAIDAAENAFVAGYTESWDIPVTPAVLGNSFAGGAYEAYVAKFDASGANLLYATYLGGSKDDLINDDGGRAIAVDGDGNAYVAGVTNSSDFPTTAGAFDTTHNGRDDAFVAVLNPTGSALVYSTYLGGSSKDNGVGLQVDSSGSVYLVGHTRSVNFPTTANAFAPFHGGGWDAFVAKLDPSGSLLEYSSYIGGSSLDLGFGIGLDDAGSVYVAGQTFSSDFPVSAGAYATAYGGGGDAFVTRLSLQGGGAIPEDCTNGVDDDGDGLADCNDPDCACDPSCLGSACSATAYARGRSFVKFRNRQSSRDSSLARICLSNCFCQTVKTIPGDLSLQLGTCGTVTIPTAALNSSGDGMVFKAKSNPNDSPRYRLVINCKKKWLKLKLKEASLGGCAGNPLQACVFTQNGPCLCASDTFDEKFDGGGNLKLMRFKVTGDCAP